MDGIPEILIRRIDECLAGQRRILVAIDGGCGSGKTTLAARLAARYDCNVFHMDDFFLRPAQRRPERYAETGGNVDYERFREEVLQPLAAGIPFAYRPFDCGSLTLGAPVPVTPRALNIVEGVYSLHPYFGSPYNLRVFLTVPPEVQRQRILLRPAGLHRRFFGEWIPMEQQYFQGFRIPETCDLIL